MANRLLAVLVLLLTATPALAQELRGAGQIRSSGPVTSEASRKIVSSLRALIGDFRAEGFTKEDALVRGAQQRFSSEMLKIDPAGRVQVYVSVPDTTDATLDVLRSHDFEIEIVNDDFRILQGWIPVEQLEALAGELGVLKIRPPSYGTTDTGPIDSQGDTIHRCDQARVLGFNGAGIMVGVSSNGVDGLATSQGAGELDAVQVLSPGSGDEGTAMLEIVHDCAPGATLAFASFGSTSLNFMQAINSLQAAGAQIIVDDRSAFVTEPVFEDSNTALNDRRVGAAVLRVTSAGNRGQTHYTGMFTPGSFDSQIPGTRHNFGGGDTLLRFEILAAPTGLGTSLVLQWGNRFSAAADDYDLCVRQTNGTLIGCSALIQNGNDDPLEFLPLVCTGPPTTTCALDVQITLFSGSPQLLQLFCQPSNSCQFDEFDVRSGSVVGHKAVPEVLAVAAVPASSPTTVESYSSAGPATILFPSFQSRFKPDLTGVDCVATSRPGFNPFCGTSAAAPHVAAAAAILMQAMGGATASIQTLTSALKKTATDLGAAGADFDFGFGRADALSAVQSPTGLTMVAALLPISRSVKVGTSATAFATMIADGTCTATGCTIAPLTSVPATFLYQATNPATNQVIGTPNTPRDIPGGAFQTFVFAFTPTAPFPPTDINLTFTCTNTAPASVVSGLTTLLLSASSAPIPDIVALAATLNNDGIVNIPGATGTGVFSVATVNVGASGGITASADTGSGSPPVGISLCQTNPATGACLAPPGGSVAVQINANATPTFGVFVTGTAPVPFDPGKNRIFVRFKDAGSVTRGATSVAVRTQ
jgi:hypothetical protein